MFLQVPGNQSSMSGAVPNLCKPVSGQASSERSRHECFVLKMSVYRMGGWCDGGVRVSASAGRREGACPAGMTASV